MGLLIFCKVRIAYLFGAITRNPREMVRDAYLRNFYLDRSCLYKAGKSIMNISIGIDKNSLLYWALGLSVGVLLSLPTRADLDLAQTPLFLTPSVDPNIMFIIDDSGSMHYEVTPDEEFRFGSFTENTRWVYPRVANVYGSGDYNSNVATVDNHVFNARARSPQINKTYYDPAVTYSPWIKADNSLYPPANPEAAYHNPENTARGYRNLTVDNTNTDTGGPVNSSLNRWRTCTGPSSGQCSTQTSNKTFYPATYFWYNGGDAWNLANFDGPFEIKAATSEYSGHGRENRTDCTGGICSYAQKIQNFANWYTYHRSRVLAARAGIGKAFAQQGEAMRVGFGAINKSSSSIDNVSTNTIIRGVRPFTGSDREQFFTDLYTLDIPDSATPLRRALDSAGQYYSRSDNRGPWGANPGQNDSTTHLECRHSYTILMTDGYWNDAQAGTAAARSNNDGTNGPTISGPDGNTFTYSAVSPFTDNRSNTLADVAMYYWKNDLRTNIPNLVPTSAINPAFWQHMVTFGVGFGVEGTISASDAFDAINTGATINWPAPSTSGTTENVDDLLHAAINSRGGFFSAADPNTFANELSNTLRAIVGRTEGSSASVATNSTRLDTNTVVYQAKFDSRDWTGQFLAYAINADGSLAATPAWDAGQNVTTQGSIGRSIFGYNPTATPFKGINFFHNNLNAAQQALLTEAQLNYVRGIQTNELQNGGTFRNRIGTNRLMGDLVNSDPWFIGDINFGYHLLPGTEGSAYSNYRNSAAYKARTPLVAIGGNGGMLHVFNATITGTGAGTEVFAYVPHAVLPKLASLTDPNYSHQYFVDGSPVAGDAYIDANGDNNKEWRTVLIGTLGAGGKGIFALDATFLDPGDSSYATAENSFLPQRVMWEINTTTAPNATDLTNVLTGSNPRFGFADYLGFTLGQASIVRMANGKFAAVFGNGYNSASHQAVLYIVDLETGALIKSLNTGVGSAGNPNGLSTPIAIDANGDRIVDAIYAGDLHGNLWKFDVSSSNTGQWDFGFKQGNTPKPLFVARDSNGVRQAITAKPQAGKHPSSGVMVYFGSGKYFETGDNSAIDPQPQTFYGIQDECVKLAGSNITCSTGDPGITRANDLVQQSIIAEDVFGDFDIRVTSHCVDPLLAIDNTNCNGISMINYLGSKQGWYMDLVFPAVSPDGERVISQALLRGGRIIFVTLIPDPEPCGYGGTSWLMELDALTGNRLVSTPFDLTGSDTIDESDMLAGVIDTNDDNLIDEDDSPMAVSGKKSKVGIIKTPGVVGAGEVEYKYTSGSTGEMETTLESVEGGAGRQSWRQLR